MRAVWQLDPEIENVVYAQTVAAVPAIARVAGSTSDLLAAIEDRSRRYTSERAALSKPLDTNADLAARALFFTVVDAPKVQVPLAELLQHGKLDVQCGEPLRVVDIGAGCGAMSLGLLDFWAKLGTRRALRISLLERDVAALRIAKAVLTASAAYLGLRCEIATSALDVTKGDVAPCDLALAGTVFNELPETEHMTLAQQMLRAVGQSGHVIIVEPALRATSRDLHRLRDGLLSQGRTQILAPCTKDDAPCPALHNEQDWCHEDRLTKLPARAHELARITGLRDGGLKFSYLLLAARDSNPLVHHRTPELRVMSSARSLKGQVQVAVCGSAGWQTVRLLRRHRGAGNQSLLDAVRGDVIRLHTDSGSEFAPAESSLERIEVTDQIRVQRIAVRQLEKVASAQDSRSAFLTAVDAESEA